MANYTPTPPRLTSVAFMTPITPNGGGDTFDASPSQHYVLLWINGSTANTVTIDDPRTATDGPEGASQFLPDVLIPATANAAKPILIQGSRFYNPATGKIALAYGGVTGSTMYIIGPIPNST